MIRIGAVGLKVDRNHASPLEFMISSFRYVLRQFGPYEFFSSKAKSFRRGIFVSSTVLLGPPEKADSRSFSYVLHMDAGTGPALHDDFRYSFPRNTNPLFPGVKSPLTAVGCRCGSRGYGCPSDLLPSHKSVRCEDSSGAAGPRLRRITFPY